MVSIRRLPGPKNPAEMTYYTQQNGEPITGTTAAKTLSSLDSQTMALTLGYFVQVQAERKLVTVLIWNHDFNEASLTLNESHRRDGSQSKFLIKNPTVRVKVFW